MLTTQINIQGDKYIYDDFAFATREGLIPDVTHHTDEAALRCPPIKGPDGTKRRFAHMCVGKHIALAAAARAMGASADWIRCD